MTIFRPETPLPCPDCGEPNTEFHDSIADWLCPDCYERLNRAACKLVAICERRAARKAHTYDVIRLAQLQDAQKILTEKRIEVVGCKPAWKALMRAGEHIGAQITDLTQPVFADPEREAQ